MVQIIPAAPREKTTKDRFAEAFGNLLSSLSQEIPQELLGRQERKQLGGLIGQDVSNIRNPDFLKMIYGQEMHNKNQEEQRKFDLAQNEEALKTGLMDYETIKKFAGEEVADFYKAAPIGGKTKIVQAIVDSMQRGEKFNDLLGGVSDLPTQETPQPNLQEIEPKERNNEKLKLPDYNIRPKGFTPKEWAENRKGWAKSNNETLTTARDRLKGNKRDVLGTKKLQQINESHELPEGLERWIINPKSGEVYGLAQLAQKSPTAAQEWTKEIARFGNRAKDAFGSRVTNFDLYQYMKQFPSLLNTAEGRTNILRMMEINYELDSLYDKAVQRIIDQKGSGNIPPEEVDRLARSLIKDREDQLFNEYLNLESENESSFMQQGISGNKPSLEGIFE